MLKEMRSELMERWTPALQRTNFGAILEEGGGEWVGIKLGTASQTGTNFTAVQEKRIGTQGYDPKYGC
jgi:hypothetical protein